MSARISMGAMAVYFFARTIFMGASAPTAPMVPPPLLNLSKYHYYDANVHAKSAKYAGENTLTLMDPN